MLYFARSRMQLSYQALAGTIVLAMSLSACGGGGGSSALPNLAQTQSLNSSNTPQISVPMTRGALAFADMGHRAANSPVSIAVVLKYNNQEQLDALIASQSGPNGTHAWLTPQQFAAQFGPTPAQEQAVVNELQRAGFTVTQRYANRTVIDATAPSAT